MLKIVLTLSTLALAAFSGTVGFCNEEKVAVPGGMQSDFEELLRAKPEYRYSVFTYPATVLNSFPLLGGRGLQLGGEYRSSQNVAEFFYLGYTKLDLKSLNSMIERQQSASENDDSSDGEKEITFHKSETMVANIGARYFFRPSTDGWFLGSLIRYQKDQVKAEYDEVAGRFTRLVAGPQGHGGHRWIWRHGGFIDFFTGAFVPVFERETSDWETEDEEKKQKAQNAYDKSALPGFMRYVVPEVNITMGYLFK